jgi:hypothetical protein
MTADRNTRIQERAYHLWLEEGRPDGRHEEHWRRAESELIEEERSLRDGSPVTAAHPGDAATGAPAVSNGRAAPVRAQDRSGGKSQTIPQAAAKPRAARSRPAASPGASGSGSRGSRRSAAKPAE